MKKAFSLTIALALCLGLLLLPVGAVTKLDEWPEALRNGKTKQFFGQDGQYLMLQEDGSLWAWGQPWSDQNSKGENGELKWQKKPVQIMSDVVYVDDSRGSSSFTAVKRDGSIWYQRNGANIEKLMDAGTGVAAAVFGQYGDEYNAETGMFRNAVYVLRENGNLSAYPFWGDVSYVNSFEPNDFERVKNVIEPEVQLLKDVSKLYSTFVLQKDGTLWSFGRMAWQGDPYDERGTTETLRKVLDNVKDVVHVFAKTYVVKADGSLWLSESGGALGHTAGIEGIQSLQPYSLSSIAALEDGSYAVEDLEMNWHTAKDIPALRETMQALQSPYFPAIVLDNDGNLWSFDMNYVDRSIDNPQFDIKSDDPDFQQQVQLTGLSKGGNSAAAPTITPAANVAYASTQTVLVNDKPVEFQMYALKDANGNPTNYVKVRDVASVLNGTSAQFDVGYDGAVNLLPGKAYTPNGSEMQTPYNGDRTYTTPKAATNINGKASNLAAILLTSDNGGGFTYYKLRDLGKALNFNVGWSKEKGVFIETDKS